MKWGTTLGTKINPLKKKDAKKHVFFGTFSMVCPDKLHWESREKGGGPYIQYHSQ
jgi:hypothetical protein